MKTFAELKEQYNRIEILRHTASEQFHAGNAKGGIFFHNAYTKKMAGWRRSFLTALASICECSYAEIRATHARYDEVDLYSRYLRNY